MAAHVGPLYLAMHSQRKAGVHSAGHTSLTRVPVGEKTKGIVSKFAVNLVWVVKGVGNDMPASMVGSSSERSWAQPPSRRTRTRQCQIAALSAETRSSKQAPSSHGRVSFIKC
jgi:hypothetical protein